MLQHQNGLAACLPCPCMLPCICMGSCAGRQLLGPDPSLRHACAQCLQRPATPTTMRHTSSIMQKALPADPTCRPAGTGTVVNKTAIKQYQQATRDRSAVKTAGGKIIRVEAHPIPEHPRPRRVQGRIGLIGDAAGYVTKCSGEGIYFAAKSGRMCAEAIAERSENGEAFPVPQGPRECCRAIACRAFLLVK